MYILTKKKNSTEKKQTLRRMLSAAAALTLGAALLFTGTGCEGKAKGNVRVGVTQFAPHPSLDNCREGFIEGLRQGGYVEGQNLQIDYQNAQADMSLTYTIAEKFARDKVNLVCAIATPSAMAAAPITQDAGIPLVFNAISEPVDAGLIDSFENPGGHITGMSDKLPSAKQVALIQALLPEAKTVGLLYTTSEASSQSQVDQFRAAAEAAGLNVKVTGVASSNDIASALDAMLPEVDCMQNLLDNTVVNALPLVLERAEANGVPVFGSEEEQVAGGCIASEGIDYVQLGIDCGLQAAKILDGAEPSSIPVGVVLDSRLTVNQETLDRFGLALPADFAARATVLN